MFEVDEVGPAVPSGVGNGETYRKAFKVQLLSESTVQGLWDTDVRGMHEGTCIAVLVGQRTLRLRSSEDPSSPKFVCGLFWKMPTGVSPRGAQLWILLYDWFVTDATRLPKVMQ